MWFSRVKKFNDNDLVVPRTVWLESQGIPMSAWLKENLKGYTKHLGEWVTWSYQKDEGMDLFNPIICLSTVNYETIVEKMKILVKGKHYDVSFSEIINKELLNGKIMSMQDSRDSKYSKDPKEKEIREMEVFEEPSAEVELHASAENQSQCKDNAKWSFMLLLKT